MGGNRNRYEKYLNAYVLKVEKLLLIELAIPVQNEIDIKTYWPGLLTDFALIMRLC